jgi:hypothetical protein
MLDDTSMDVDYDVPKTPPPSIFSPSIFRDTPTSPSSLSLLRDQVNEFKMQMMVASGCEDWSARLVSAGDDGQKLQNVLISVLSVLTMVLRETTLQKRVFAPSRSQALKLVQSLNDSEVEELKNVVQIGDWMGLITHCTCLACFQKYICNLVLAQQNFRNQLKISLLTDKLKRLGTCKLHFSLSLLLYLRAIHSQSPQS